MNASETPPPPRPIEVAAGVSCFPVRTPTLPPATHTNAYAIGTKQVVLVEPATVYDDEQEAWAEWAQQLASRGAELQGIIITHYHPDHVGGARALSRAVGVPLWAHEDTAKLLPDLEIARTLHDGEVLTLDGPYRQNWQCLVTPGHAPGHLCLHEASLGTTIVGDMVASEGTILIDPSDGHLATYLQQLERLDQLEASVALPAHGAPIKDPRGCYQHYLRHRRGREEKVYVSLRQNSQTIDELVTTAYDDVAPTLWPWAKRSLESHLIKLAEDERAEKSPEGWRRIH